MKISEIISFINGEIYGNLDIGKVDFNGKFTFLNEASNEDIVIRHWIDAKGIEIAKNKNIKALITQNPKDNAIEAAENLNFPLIITNKIELATSFALKWTIEKFSPNSINIVVSGTNGKSTTSHLIYHILNYNNYCVFTNTDSESEFNTLIDPMVSKLIYDQIEKDGKIDYLVIEVSEVQGWLGSLMKNHAFLMTKAINPDVAIITNIAMDHIGLVNSIDEVFYETSGVVRALNHGAIVLNKDDKEVKKLEQFIINKDVSKFFVSMEDKNNKLFFDKDLKSIFYNGNEILKESQLPFKSNHFIQNILSAIAVCISLGIDIEEIVEGVKSYKSLKRRFTKLNDKPLIIDDFAHNPEGIKATVKETAKLVSEKSNFYIICAIRGSRGEVLNKLNAEALACAIPKGSNLVISLSNDVVDSLNFVKDEEKDVFFNVLNQNAIDYLSFDNLFDALKDTYQKASDKDVILLIGAQGMDPAEGLLSKILY